MSEPKYNLEQIQRWVQAVVTHPHGVNAGVKSAEAPEQMELPIAEPDQIVSARGALTEQEALAIYNRGYRSRLLDCFRAEYPVLKHALGDELFDQFAIDYLAHYPSRTHSLIYLCRNFPQHLEATRPDSELPQESRESWPDFIVDLARLERLFNEAFHGPGVEDQEIQNGDSIRGLRLRQLEKSRITTVPCLTLTTFRYPVSLYFDAVRRRKHPLLPEKSATYTALNRRDYKVRLYTMPQTEFVFLTALMNGESVHEATDMTAHASGADYKVIQSQLAEVLAEWADRGFVQSIC